MLNAEVATSATTGVVVEGNFSFNPISGLLDAGENVEVWITFTPIDTRNFKVSEFKITVTINKANPTFEQMFLAYNFTFGEELGIYSTELANEEARGVAGEVLAGEFEFVNGTSYKPAAGSEGVWIRFTPLDSNYNVEYFYLLVFVDSGDIEFTQQGIYELTYGETVTKLIPLLTQEVAIDKITSQTISGEFVFENVNEVPQAGEVVMVRVEFRPTDILNYSVITFELRVKVNQATLVFNRSNEYEYTFGEELNKLLDLLNSEVVRSIVTDETVEGLFRFENGTSRPNATVNSVFVIFTPDSPNFRILEIELEITVDRAYPEVSTFVGTYVFTFGQPLSVLMDILITETANVPGSFAFLNPDSVLDAGTQLVTVVFTPEDIVNYKERNVYVMITINPIDPDMSGVVIEAVIVLFTGSNHTVDLSELVLPYGVEIDRIEYSNRRDIGTHSFTVFFKVTNSTNFIVPDSLSGTLIILPTDDGPNWLLIGTAGGAGALVLIATISFIVRAQKLKKVKTGRVDK
jgi:hypothetical protein